MTIFPPLPTPRPWRATERATDGAVVISGPNERYSIGAGPQISVNHGIAELHGCNEHPHRAWADANHILDVVNGYAEMQDQLVVATGAVAYAAAVMHVSHNQESATLQLPVTKWQDCDRHFCRRMQEACGILPAGGPVAVGKLRPIRDNPQA